MNAAPLLFVLVGVAVVVYGAYSFLQDGKRRQALAAYAASNQWTYAAEDDSLAVRWNGTPFGQGDRRRARNVLAGASRGRPFTAFDYQFDTETSSGVGNDSMFGGVTVGNRRRTTHHFFVVAVRLPTWLPGLQVTPDNVLTRAAAAVGIGTGIELESEDFNRHFHVTAHNPKFASDVLTPRTMEQLLRGSGLAWRIEGQDIVSWGPGKVEAVALLSRLQTLCGVVDGVPEFVWKDNGYDPGASATPAPPAEGSMS
jgi:hypothetical protein